MGNHRIYSSRLYRRFVQTKPSLQSRKASRVIRIELNGLLAKSEICTWLIQRFSKDNHQIISDYQHYTIIYMSQTGIEL